MEFKKMKKFKDIMEKEYKIYCDMDGVLCDFDKRFTGITGLSPERFVEKNGNKEFWKVIGKKGEKYWSAIEWMPDGKKLWKYIKQFEPYILSSPSYDKSSRTGKYKWLEKNIPSLPKDKIILAHDKSKYADKSSILIDDNKDKITKWIDAGGIGILHINTATTLKELKRNEDI